jgi:hypothetical protein
VSRGRAALVLLVAAALLLLPSLAVGTLVSHNAHNNLSWAKQFADQFRAGILYPRWLPESFDGLGVPGLYFYPPIAFWADALLSAATFNLLSVSYRLALSALLLLWASGLAMRAWLGAEAVSPRVALVGAVAYMAAPYHLLDHYWRGAYAEFAAYVVLPLLMLAVRHVAERRRFSLIFLAVAYAALPMTHLPTALLISLTALPMYVLYRAWQLGAAQPALGFLGRCAVAGVLGLGLAAIYLVPALTLQDWLLADTLWSGYFDVENWFLLAPHRWPRPTDMMWAISSFAAAYAFAAIGVVALVARRLVPGQWRSETAFWSLIALACLLLVAGAVPWFWQLPFVSKVQFPWRMMIVVEFAAISALCTVPWPVPRRTVAYIFIAAVIVLLPGLGEMGERLLRRTTKAVAQKEEPVDLRQFLPAGFPLKLDVGSGDRSLGPVEDAPIIACTPQPRTCHASEEPFGGLRVDIDAEMPTDVVLRRFYFPFWQLEPARPISASDPLRLVSFTASPGRAVYRLKRAVVPAEKAGWLISGASLILLLGATALGRRLS